MSVVARDRWRSLTFQSNEDAVATQQGLCLVDADGAALPGSLVFTYLRTAAAAVAALAPSPGRPRYLALGLGAGGFPAFLQHHAPGALVQAVDIDPLVVRVAREQLGCRFDMLSSTAELVSGGKGSSAGFQVLVNDAAPCIAALAEAVTARSAQPADAVLLDCYDQFGRVPPILDSPEFFTACCEALSPGGLLMLNSFNAEEGSETRDLLGSRAAALAAAFGDFARLFTFPVLGFESNIVLVIQKAGGLAGASRAEMVARARGVSFAQGWAFDAGDVAAAALRLWPMPFGRGRFWESVPGVLFGANGEGWASSADVAEPPDGTVPVEESDYW